MPKRYIYGLIPLILLLIILARKYIYYDKDNGCYIKIIPSIFVSNWNPKEAIFILKKELPDQYKLFCRNVNTISVSPSCGGLDGGCYYPNSDGKIYIGPDNRDVALSVAILAHETCHAIQEHENRGISEQECYKVSFSVYKHLIDL